MKIIFVDDGIGSCALVLTALAAFACGSDSIDSDEGAIVRRAGGRLGQSEQSRPRGADSAGSEVEEPKQILARVLSQDSSTRTSRGSENPTNILGNGAPCSAPAECKSEFCVDGVCCDTACGGNNPVDCLGCSKAVGAATNGTCQTLPANTTCRPAVDTCDVDEHCDGMSTACPPDALLPAGTVCRPAAGDCDLPEACTGNHPLCPPDVLAPSGTLCRPSMGGCDTGEACSGLSPLCPPDGLLPAGTVCRPALGICDLPEVCSGADPRCPPDLLLPPGTPCRAPLGACDLTELCTGITGLCPIDLLAPPGTLCRPAGSECDTPEYCTGSDLDCPCDSFVPDGAQCSIGRCDNGICAQPRSSDGNGSASVIVTNTNNATLNGACAVSWTAASNPGSTEPAAFAFLGLAAAYVGRRAGARKVLDQPFGASSARAPHPATRAGGA